MAEFYTEKISNIPSNPNPSTGEILYNPGNGELESFPLSFIDEKIEASTDGLTGGWSADKSFPSEIVNGNEVILCLVTGYSGGIGTLPENYTANIGKYYAKSGGFTTVKADATDFTGNTTINQTINNNTYELDPQQIVPSEALYTDDTLAGDILKRIDKPTGESVNYRETTVWKDGSTMTDAKIDGVIYIKKDAKYYKRVYSGYADPRWFGAKGDGVDLGIGDFTGDHDAINLALSLCQKVKLEYGTFVVKKPIVLNSENELFIDATATLQLGKAANCTLIKNSNVNLYKNADGIATYPSGFKKHKNIKIEGNGTIDFNGWFQNRSNSAGGGVQDNPDVVGTTRFDEAAGIGTEYVGLGSRFTEIDGFFFGGGLTLKNARTWTISLGNVTNYDINGIIAERNYFVQNQDFINISGGCFDGKIRNINGVSGDEFIVLATTSLGQETLRSGDIKRLKVSNISYYGIDPTATPTNQKPMPTFEDNFPSHRLMRISNTKSFIVDDIIIEDCNATASKLHSQIIIAKLPFSGGTTEAQMYAGNGYIGNVIIRNVNCPNQEGLVETSNYTYIKNLNIENIIDRRVGLTEPRHLIRNEENFTGLTTDYKNSVIDNLNLINVRTIIGGGTNQTGSIINWDGRIKRLVIDNFSIKAENDEDQILLYFAKSNIKEVLIINSSFPNIDKMFLLSNPILDSILIEVNSTFRGTKSLESQNWSNAQTQNLKMLSDNIAEARNGDSIRTPVGLKYFNASDWNIR